MRTIKVGDYVRIINEYGSFLRKVTYVGDNKFEWNYGWAKIEQLTLNNNNKFILDYERN